ncbi:hypothetical protein [Chryseolinea soli]|nr:hypothetical protein [Chryseolinea soli]
MATEVPRACGAIETLDIFYKIYGRSTTTTYRRIKHQGMKIEEIERKVKQYIGFESLGFYEHSQDNRIYVMLKNEGEAIYRIRYEFHPKAGVDELNFNWTVYDVIFPVVNQVLKQALSGAT